MKARTVVAGVDGSPESRAAAEWAATEALLRDASLRLVHAWVRRPYEYAPLAGVQSPLPARDADWQSMDEPMLVGARRYLQHRHPGLVVSAEELAEPAVPALLDAARDAELLVLGTRWLGAVAGFLVGSVAQGAVARAWRPVVLVGAEPAEAAQDGAEATAPGPSGDVVLGLDTRQPAGPVMAFAFDTASRHTGRLRVVHGHDGGARASRTGHPDTGSGQELNGALRIWRERFPDVHVDEEVVAGRAAAHLVDASQGAALLVVGRKAHRSRLGAHIGSLTRTVLHHAHAPVAVVPHG